MPSAIRAQHQRAREAFDQVAVELAQERLVAAITATLDTLEQTVRLLAELCSNDVARIQRRRS